MIVKICSNEEYVKGWNDCWDKIANELYRSANCDDAFDGTEKSVAKVLRRIEKKRVRVEA